ncbi:hypothetical protein Tco_0699315 [Tanacetum coccineum]
MGEENPIRTLGDYSKPSHEGYRNIIELPVGNNVVPLRSDTIRLVQNRCSFHGLWSEDPNQHLKDFLKLVDSLNLNGENTERIQSWALLEDLALYANESWNDPRDFAKPVKEITLPQDVPSTSDCRLIELENQVQHLIEAHLAPTQPTQVNKITTSCEICSGPHDTQYCMEDPKQAFVEYASSRIDEAGEALVSNFMASQDARLPKFEADFKQQQSEMTNKIGIVLKAITDRIARALPSDTVKNPKLKNKEEEKGSPENIHVNPSIPPDPSVAFITKKFLKFNSFLESLRLVFQSSDNEVVFTKGDDGEVMFTELIRKNDDSSEEEPEEEGSTTTKGVILDKKKLGSSQEVSLDDSWRTI